MILRDGSNIKKKEKWGILMNKDRAVAVTIEKRRQIPRRIIAAIENSLVVTDDVNWWLSTVSERRHGWAKQNKKNGLYILD